MLKLGERIFLILTENDLKQKEMAKEIGVSESYISAIINGRNTKISQTLAALIEEKYGYNKNWVLHGTEPKYKSVSRCRKPNDIYELAYIQIERLSPPQIKAVLAFVKSLEEIESSLK
ncbi:MAG: helix-turn-helix transcriptional regulator [Lachnospiraceae bacterium]|nr:helix-turn-helix transcriptional regulator [Lachnospiraceae bacterium]